MSGLPIFGNDAMHEAIVDAHELEIAELTAKLAKLESPDTLMDVVDDDVMRDWCKRNRDYLCNECDEIKPYRGE